MGSSGDGVHVDHSGKALLDEEIHCWGQLFGVLMDPWHD